MEIFLNNDGGHVSSQQGFVRTTGLQLFRRTAFLLALAGSLSHGFCGCSWGPDLPLSLPEGEGTFPSRFCANISLLVHFGGTMTAFVSTSLFLNSKCTLALLLPPPSRGAKGFLSYPIKAFKSCKLGPSMLLGQRRFPVCRQRQCLLPLPQLHRPVLLLQVRKVFQKQTGFH